MSSPYHPPHVEKVRKNRHEIGMVAVMATIITLLNGLSDQTLQDLEGKTPLQAAKHPALDRLAQNGGCHFLETPPGTACEHSLLSLCGIQDGLGTITRAPLEALSIGYALKPGEIAFSMRFVAAGDEIVVDVSNELLSNSEGKLLCDHLGGLFQDEGFCFLHLQGPRAILVTDGGRFEGEIASASLSPIDVVGRTWQELIPHPALLAMAQRAHTALVDHEINRLKCDLEEEPVTALLISEGSERPLWTPPQELQGGLLFTTSPASRGVAATLGLELLTLPPEAKKYDHLRILQEELPNLARKHDLIIIELAYLFESTYRGDLLEKIKTIEWLDRNWVAPLADFCAQETHVLVIMPLRQSDIRDGCTVGGPVPLVTNRPGQTLNAFDEVAFSTLSPRPSHSIQSVLLGGLCEPVERRGVALLEAARQ